MSGALADADAGLLDRLGQALGPGGVVEAAPRYLEEPRGRLAGRAAAVLRPADTAGVVAAVRLCAAARVGIVPYSGGTGLVGGQIAGDGPLPVLMSFERMDRVRSVDATDNVIVAEAGVVLADLQAAAAGIDRLFPLSLASEGSARLGGLLATNAGGVNVLRYGNARDLCLGVEAVMADGTVIRGLSPLIKDNLGYDLRHLLVGSEGTLGLITAASLRLHPMPRETATGWLAVRDPATALALLAGLRARLGGTIAAFELMHVEGMRFLAGRMPTVALPPAFGTEWIVLVEATDGAESGLADRFEAALGAMLEEDLVADALIAQSEGQRDAFWTVRETIPEANRLIGSVSSHDVSVPPSRLAEFVARAGDALAGLDPSLRVNCFGHLGDGNLHYNVFPAEGRARSDYDAIRGRVKTAIHDLVHDVGGSVAAEHGVGRIKVGDLERYGDPGKLAAMRAIKAALDPEGILNPGAVLRGESGA